MTPTATSTVTPTATPTASGPVYLGGLAGLAAPMLIPGPAPALAPLTTTHRVISYTCPTPWTVSVASPTKT